MDIFWLVVGGGGLWWSYFGWWWVVVDGGGCWWVALGRGIVLSNLLKTFYINTNLKVTIMKDSLLLIVLMY